MFGKKIILENRCIIAVKDYAETLQKLKEGKISLPYNRNIYLKMIESQSDKVDDLKGIRKFAKANNKKMSEVGHYWEGLVVDGYTLLNIEYADRIPAIDHVCANDTIKFVCIA